ncbi:SMI1/KNR4 family protein [Shimazuella kribbensis]|uniref:SMI1/KNR4 family protein n=1 Tax=Shimazuella kribbensis TaxID=139808 RepID=UPI000425CF63|nr:SMI1/KNR4 family protein [Shimazuella kribbensis]
MKLVHETLDELKKQLINNKLSIQDRNGVDIEMEFQFDKPASETETEAFIHSTELQLPEDYKAFLQIHNGATLFQPWYGGQFELYGLSSIHKQKNLGLFMESWYPIGYQDGGYLMIDGKKANQGEQDYLLWWESSIVEDAKNLCMNFVTWLDQFILAQGKKFWDHKVS